MRKPSTLPNALPESTAYPFGGFKDETDSSEGTELIEAAHQDYIQNLLHVLTVAGVTPDGTPDNATKHQLFDAMMTVFSPIRTKVISKTAVWNMETTASYQLAHGLSWNILGDNDATYKILNVRVVIHSDVDGLTDLPLDGINPDTGVSNGGIVSIDNTNINMVRTPGQRFASSDYSWTIVTVLITYLI